MVCNTSPKGMESKKPIKIEETQIPRKSIVVQSCSKKKTFFFAACGKALAFPSRRITGDDHPFDEELFPRVALDPPGEPRPHQRLQALARRAEAAEEEL